jgi:hypothetical protein
MNEIKKVTPEEFRAKFQEMIQRMKEQKSLNIESNKTPSIRELLENLKQKKENENNE